MRALHELVEELPELDLRKSELLRACLDLPERLATALDKRVVLAWDEFQALAQESRTAPLIPVMRSVWQHHERVTYVVSGSEPTLLQEMVNSPEAPFFQHFTILELGPLPRRDAVELLVQGAPPDRPVPRALAERAVDVLGGHPFYLQHFGDELTRDTPPYDDAALKETMQRLLFSPTGRLALYFQGRYAQAVGRSTQLAATLAALAGGATRLTDVAKAVGVPSGAAVRNLVRLGDIVVRREAGGYAIADPVFALWIRWRSPGGTVVPMRVLGDEGERRIAEHLAALGFDLVYQSRASRGAFDLLALRGGRVMAIQVKRRALPLRFTPGEWARMEAESRRTGWRWVVAAVDPDDDAVTVLDPGRVETLARSRRLGAPATIENLLLRIDENDEP